MVTRKRVGNVLSVAPNGEVKLNGSEVQDVMSVGFERMGHGVLLCTLVFYIDSITHLSEVEGYPKLKRQKTMHKDDNEA